MNNNEIKETIKQLKLQFRSLMNGPVSSSMREKGLAYKVIFGVEQQRLRNIASEMEKNHELAGELWKEDIRECRIMATLLQPIDTFYPEIADIWVESMHYGEEAEYCVMNLFQYLPYASEKAFQWIADEREMFQQCGFLLLARLFMREGAELREQSAREYLDQASVALHTKGAVAKAALSSLNKYALMGEKQEAEAEKLIDTEFLSKE